MIRSSRIRSRAYPRARAVAVLGAVVAATALGAACGGDDGTSRRARSPRPPVEVAPRPRFRWPHHAELASLRTVREGLRSSHLVGDPESTLRTNELGEGYGRRGAVLPAGTLLVVSHQHEGGLLHFAMKRPPRASGAGDPVRPAPWEYTVVDDAGWIVESGRIPSCVRCHEEAPADEVFGPGSSLHTGAPPP